MNREELEKLPKIDLHCHLDGSLTLESARDLLKREVSINELQVSDDCTSLAEYLEKFDLPVACIQNEAGLTRVSYDFLKEVSKENVKYVEVRFAPLLSVNENLNCRQVIQAVITGLEKAKEEVGTEYNVIVCAMRHHTEEENLEMFKVAKEFLGKGVCAGDLAGNEAAFPMKEFFNLFAKVKEMGMPFTLHAGECHSVENVVDSVKAGALRVGHGIALSGNDEAIKLCRDKKIGIEMCPISNLQTKAVAKDEKYPMKEFLDAGLMVTINTDNRMVSNTTITKEIEFVQANYGITDEEIRQMMKNAIEVSFASKEVKAKLLKEIQL